MKIDTKYKSGLTAEEIALVAMGLNEEHTKIPVLWRRFAEEHDSKPENKISLKDKVREAMNIKDALLMQISIAYQRLANPAETTQTTLIELLEPKYTALDGSNIRMPILEETIITIISATRWLYVKGEKDKANLLDLEESLKLSKIDDYKIKEISGADFCNEDTPDSLYYGYSVFKACWRNLPKTMKTPTKAQVRKYVIEIVGIDEKETGLIENIINASPAKGCKYGSVQSSSLDEWLPLSDRNKSK